MTMRCFRPVPRGINDEAGPSGDPRPGTWDWDLAIENPMLEQLLGMRTEKCRNDLFPPRPDFDSLDMRDLLGGLFILEAEPGAQDFRYTLIGTGVTEQVGRDNTGRTVSEVFGVAVPQLCR